MKKICKYCNKEMEYQSGKQFGGHLTNCNSNPKKILRDLSTTKQEFEFICNCGCKYIVFDTINSIDKGRYRKFCSYKCANSRIHSEETKRKISEKLSTGINYHIHKCLCCEKNFESRKKISTFCSKSCATRHRNLNGLAITAGRASASSQQKRSKNEVAFAELCGQKFNIITNESIFNGWDADIIIPSLKIAILWNGNWHYEKITNSHSIKQVKNRDRIKIIEIVKFGYVPYIIEDRGKYDMNKVNDEWIAFNKWILLFYNQS